MQILSRKLPLLKQKSHNPQIPHQFGQQSQQKRKEDIFQKGSEQALHPYQMYLKKQDLFQSSLLVAPKTHLSKGCPSKFLPKHKTLRLFKNYRAQNKPQDPLGIVFPFGEIHFLIVGEIPWDTLYSRGRYLSRLIIP